MNIERNAWLSGAFLLLITLFSGGSPEIQGPPSSGPAEIEAVNEAAVRKLLLSAKSHERAYGAWYAGKYQLNGVANELIESLRLESVSEDKSNNRARILILDAMARLRVDAPEELLFSRADAETLDVVLLILLNRSEDHRGGLIKLFQVAAKDSQASWAAARALATTGDMRIAPELVPMLKVVLRIFVWKAGEIEEPYDSHEGGGGYWNSPHAMPPPRVSYHFSDRPEAGAIVVIAGRLPVYAMREEALRGGATVQPVRGRAVAKNAWDCLQELLKQNDVDASETGFNVTSLLSFEFTTNDDYVARIEEKRDSIKQNYRLLLNKLRAAKLIGAQEGPAPVPQITVMVEDYRDEDAPPLPEIR